MNGWVECRSVSELVPLVQQVLGLCRHTQLSFIPWLAGMLFTGLFLSHLIFRLIDLNTS